MKFKLDFTAICIYVATLTTALLSVADVLPLKWLPYIIVAGKLADAFTPRAAKRHPRTIPPQAGRGQSGHIRLSSLLALLTLCLPLPLVLTGCPKSGSQDASAIRPRAERVLKVVEHAAGDLEAAGDATRELRAGGLVSDDGARAIAQATLEANTILAEAVNQALGYQSLDEFARAGLYTHLDKLRSALVSLNERGALHIKNERKRALFATLLVASDLVLRRAQSDFDTPLPDGTSIPLDAALRRKLERARDTLARNDRKLREDLARTAPKDTAAV